MQTKILILFSALFLNFANSSYTSNKSKAESESLVECRVYYVSYTFTDKDGLPTNNVHRFTNATNANNFANAARAEGYNAVVTSYPCKTGSGPVLQDI